MQQDNDSTIQQSQGGLPEAAEYKQTTVKIPLDLWKRWSHSATDQQSSMTALLIVALEEYLSGKAKS